MFLMVLFLSIMIILLRGGSFKNLLYFKYNKEYICLGGILVLASINLLTTKDLGTITDFFIKYYFYFHILGLALIFISLLFNLRVKGVKLIAIGVCLNTIPILLNGKMPVNLDALKKIDNDWLYYVISNNLSLSHGVFENPKCYFLSDIFAFKPRFMTASVISLGDLIICLGLIYFIYNISRRKDA